MAMIGRFLKLMGKVVLDKLLGKERTEELVSLIQEWRSGPLEKAEAEIAAAKEEATEPSTLRATVATVLAEGGVAGGKQEEFQEKVELLLAQAVPSVSPELLGLEGDTQRQSAGEVAKRFADDALPTPKANTFLLWLQPPHLDDPGCFCHFSYQFNEGTGKVSFRVRDYIHRKLYWGVTEAEPPGDQKKWAKKDWSRYTALDLWQAARKHVRCRGAFSFSIEEVSKWRNTLDEMTQSLTP
jgi:hypothetical protein